jgi:hypothetical protein
MAKRSISTEQMYAAYKQTGNVWKAGDVLGCAGQTVHKRLTAAGLMTPMNKITEVELEQIRQLYQQGFEDGDGKLMSLAAKIGRTKHFVCRCARRMGLTNPKRKACESTRRSISDRVTKAIATHGHPRGMLGKKHSITSRMIMSYHSAMKTESKEQSALRTERMMATKMKRYGKPGPMWTRNASWKSGWREIGGKRIYARSRWEANIAAFLEFKKTHGQIKEWEHEPETFWFDGIKRGCRSYLPDFKVTENDGQVHYIEVKGWMDNRSRTKIRRMRIYHPTVKLRVIGSKEYLAIERQMRGLVEGWETNDKKNPRIEVAVSETKVSV